MRCSIQNIVSAVATGLLVGALSTEAGATPPRNMRPVQSLSACLDRANTNAQMQACAAGEFGRQDARLNTEYKAARLRLNARQAAILQQEQRAWLRDLDRRCNRGGGSNAGVSALLCRAKASEHRADYLANYRLPGRPAPSSLGDWIGRWDGPEGLFAQITPGRGERDVRLVIRDSLDHQDSYVGHFTGTTIRFERQGRTETIRRGSGLETGFSALRGRRDCLIVIPNREGYCRRS